MNIFLPSVILPFFLGASTFVLFSPFSLWFLALPLYAALYNLTVKCACARDAFWIGASFSTGVLVATYYWLVAGMEMFLAAARPDLVFLPAFFIALGFWALFFLSVMAAGIATFACRVSPVFKPWIFAVLLTLAEACRGMPSEAGSTWGMTGHAVAGFLPLAQLAAIGSVYLPGFLLIFAGAAMASRPARATGFIMLLTACLWGFWRIETAPDTLPSFNRAAIELTQAALPQPRKLQDRSGLDSFHAHYSLSAAREETPPGQERPVVIWPETAIPAIYEENEGMRQEIAHLNRNARLVTGLRRRSNLDSDGKRWTVNAVAVIDRNGKIYASRSKSIAVPFLERIPYRKTLQPLYDRWLPFLPETEQAREEPLLEIPALGTAMVVNCYESGFPFFVRRHAPAADFLLVLANDAWFKGTPAPALALSASRLRAIENGMTLVRVSNGGNNAVIDPYGRYLALENGDDAGTVTVQKLPSRITDKFYW